ncbi:MAG: hypothetical protein IKZ88_06895 [Neisseriaceae bacterium]|nr:hypothetical protein [Neisseriaceae bacterium]
MTFIPPYRAVWWVRNPPYNDTCGVGGGQECPPYQYFWWVEDPPYEDTKTRGQQVAHPTIYSLSNPLPSGSYGF